MGVKVTVPMIKEYINAGLRVSIMGLHGIGKTAIISEASKELGLKMKYYSSSTIDPYTELTGIPIPNHESRQVEFWRPHSIDEAEVIFFDEANRADPKTINALFEITQFGTINGEPLPNLKTVLIAMNPVGDDYETDELDPAFMDRFDVFLDMDPAIDARYFTKLFGERVGLAAVDFWEEHERGRLSALRSQRNTISYLSPRRMEKIVNAFTKIPTRQMITNAIPPEFNAGRDFVSTLYATLRDAMKEPSSDEVASEAANDAKKILRSSIRDQVRPETGVLVTKLLEAGSLEAQEEQALLDSLAIALNSSAGVKRIADHFLLPVSRMKQGTYSILTQDWSDVKVKQLQRLMKSVS